jgi:hypothetical protein
MAAISSKFITMFRRAMGETPQRFLRNRTVQDLGAVQ